MLEWSAAVQSRAKRNVTYKLLNEEITPSGEENAPDLTKKKDAENFGN